MRIYTAGTVFAVVLGLASLAQAAQLLSPPYAVTTRASNGVGTKAACVIRNTGTESAAVKVSLLTSVESVGIFDFCNGHTLGGGQTCLVSAEIFQDLGKTSYVACKVTAPNIINLRGTLEFAESPSHGFDVYLAVDF